MRSSTKQIVQCGRDSRLLPISTKPLVYFLVLDASLLTYWIVPLMAANGCKLIRKGDVSGLWNIIATSAEFKTLILPGNGGAHD